MDKNDNKYNPPNLNDKKPKIETFDIIENKERKPIIPNIPSVQKILSKKSNSNSNNNNNNEENIINNEYSSIPINEENIEVNNNNINNKNNNNNNQQEDFIASIKETLNKFFENKTVSIIINPFQNSSDGVQLCYKIYSAITLFIVFLVIILSICFT